MLSERANATVFVACDRVIEEKDTGKKTLVGIFQNFHFQQLPARAPAPWYLVAQVQNMEPGKHDVTINIVHDETTGVVFAAGLEIPHEHPPDIDMVIFAQETQFHKEGKHVVTLNIDGNQSAYFVLNVNLRKQKVGE